MPMKSAKRRECEATNDDECLPKVSQTSAK